MTTAACEPGRFCPDHPDRPWFLFLAAVAVLALILLATAAVLLACATGRAASLIRRHLTRTHRKETAMPDTTPDYLTGLYGSALQIPHDNYRTASPAALEGWIITATCWHPHWTQYSLSVVSLADIPGAPPAKLQRPGMTHELTVVALDPDYGPYDARTIGAGGQSLAFLLPPNIAEQFTTTDDHARRLATLCARAVVDGFMCPETADAPDRIRVHWRTTIGQTLEHDAH